MTNRSSLIVTADDLGISSHVNTAVIEAHRRGILRFASLMVTEDAAEDAVRRVRSECPGLGIGLHLVLCSGRSALPAAHLEGIVDENRRFSDDPVVCGMRYFFGRGLQSKLEMEIRAQFERFLAFGLPPGHVDGHVNIHMHPVIFPMLLRLAREYGFGRVRTTGGELCISARYSLKPLGKQLLEGTVFGLMRKYLLRACDTSRLETSHPVLGLLRSGLMNEDYVISSLRRLPDGLCEIYFHPSADPNRVPTGRPLPGHHSFAEFEALMSPKVKAALLQEGVELVQPQRAGRPSGG